MRYAWLILAVFGAEFFASANGVRPTDGGLPWQRWLGDTIRATRQLPATIGPETFTAPGAPWVPHEWLFSLLASVCSGAGWPLFVTSAALAATAALVIGGLRAARGGATSLALAVVLPFAGFALLQSFGVRVQVAAWPFLALFMLLIEFNSRVAYVAIAVAALWSNVHASVMLAAPLAFAATAGSYLDERWSARTKRTLLVAVGSLLAACCNPLGAALPRYALGLFSGTFKDAITEWKHTDIGDVSFALGALPLLLIILTVGTGGATRWRDRSLVLLCAALMFGALRNVAVFAIVCFPIAARVLSTGGSPLARPDRAPRTRAEHAVVRLLPVVSAVLAGVLAFAFTGPSRAHARASAPIAPALAAVRALPGTRHVLCADFAWCNALVGTAADRIFLDGRADPYPPDVWSDFDTIVSARPGWDRALRSRGTDVIVVGVTSPLEAVLSLSGRWRSRYSDGAYRVWTLAPMVHGKHRRHHPASTRLAHTHMHVRQRLAPLPHVGIVLLAPQP